MADQTPGFPAAAARSAVSALARRAGGVDWAGGSTTLWREREALEQLLFKLFEQHLVLAAGNLRWLHLVDEEVHAAAESVRVAELIRSAEFEVLGRRAGLPAAASLREFAAAAPEPWPLVFDDHRTALHELAREVRARATDNTRMLQAGANATREKLWILTDRPPGPDGSRAATARIGGAVLLDQQA